MKIKITYRVLGKEFSAEADTIAEAYEYVEAIIRSNEIVFPNLSQVLSEYMIALAKMHNCPMTKENHIFRIER